MTFIEKIAPYWKAIVAFLVPGVAVLVTFITGDEGFADVTTAEWLLVAVALITPIAVYAKANVPTEG